MKIQDKQKQAKSRQERTRRRIIAESGRPRLHVHRSLQHLYAQVIDDVSGKTLAAASTHELKDEKGTKSERAAKVGELIATKAKKEKVKKVAFDRGSYKYHGRIKALAEAARKAGLEF